MRATMEREREDNLIGESPAFLESLERVSAVAPLNRPVLLIGERGTGKELFAARLHYLSSRWDRAFLKLNCAALAESVLESELFGHEAGAFTGAVKKRAGRFELADGGTLFLDELANTPQAVQEKILRVIEYGEFERVGGSRPIATDVRIIAATNEDLPALAAAGKFREDLLDRLAFDVITLPPLRHRGEDILPLAEHFAVRMAQELGLELFVGFAPEARTLLLNYRWPGNVRELKNVVERAVYRHGGSEEPIEAIVFDPFESPWRPARDESAATREGAHENDAADGNRAATELDEPLDFKAYIQEIEIETINGALERNRYNQRKTAEDLGLTYDQLRGYLRKYKLATS